MKQMMQRKQILRNQLRDRVRGVRGRMDRMDRMDRKDRRETLGSLV